MAASVGAPLDVSAVQASASTLASVDTLRTENPVQGQRYAGLESTSINIKAAAAMAEDDKFMWLKLHRGEVHSTSVVDDAAIEV